MKKLIVFFVILALTAVSMMFWDYNERPFNPKDDYIGNPKYSIILYPLLVFIELAIIVMVIKKIKNKSWVMKSLVLLFFGACVVFSFFDTMRGGGVLATHALWLLVSFVVLILTFLLNRQNSN